MPTVMPKHAIWVATGEPNPAVAAVAALEITEIYQQHEYPISPEWTGLSYADQYVTGYLTVPQALAAAQSGEPPDAVITRQGGFIRQQRPDSAPLREPPGQSPIYGETAVTYGSANVARALNADPDQMVITVSWNGWTSIQ